MRPHPTALALAVATLATACSGSDTETPAPAGWQGQHVTTLDFAADDNSEVIKLLPDGSRAVLVASKTRRVTLLAVTPGGLTELRSANLFGDDASESELTHIDFDSQGRFAAITRTLPITDGGALVDCQGSLVFVDVSDTDTFGAVLAEHPVGPMPDTVDISPDDRWVVTGDEKDFDDKCGIDGPTPSVTLFELPTSDPTTARVRARITMVTGADEAPREPEQIIFAADSDLVAATLQDSHEVLFFRRSALLADSDDQAIVEVGSDTLDITPLPPSSSGADPWPDGLAAYPVGDETYFVVTGEYNDVIYVIGSDGRVRSTTEITDAIVPDDFPRGTVEEDYVRFRPDSVDTFEYAGRWYAAASIKLAGAVGVWDVTDPTDIFVADMVKIGFDDTPGSGASTLGTEGISARAGVIVTANEGESSASLVAPLE